MKRFHTSVLLAAVLGVASLAVFPTTPVLAAEAGEYDFGEFAVPANGGQFVEVNLTRDLISIATRLISKEEPDVAAVLAGLQKVRVHVIGVDDTNRGNLSERIATARADLAKRGWQRVVSVRESGAEVDIYLKTKSDEMIDGVVVTVLNKDDQAVFINVVGNIKPEQIAMLGERFGIDPLKEAGQHAAHGG